MRHIQKQKIPETFRIFITEKRPNEWGDIHQALPPVYEFVCEALLEEQDSLCGYTEIPLKKENKHIDHYYKRALYPEKCFSWENLILAVKDESFGAKFKDKRINNKDLYGDIFNPVIDYPENFFEYNSLGEIFPKENIPANMKERANKTIEIFNLNDKKLTNRRRQIVIGFYSYKNGKISTEETVHIMKKDGFVSLINWLKENELFSQIMG